MRARYQILHLLGLALLGGFFTTSAAAQEAAEEPKTVERMISVPAQIDKDGVIIKPAQTLRTRVPAPNTQARSIPSAITPEAVRGLTIIDRPVRWERGPTLHRSVIARGGVWYSPDIPVCWEDASPDVASTLARAWTELAVTNTWEHVSDVDFTGWGNCDQTDGGGIRIKVQDTGPNVAEIGRQLDGLPGGMTLNFTFANWGQGCATHLEYCIKALAVHEFGHALGLAHEHNRDDRTACDTEPQGPLPSYILTAYDTESVMNYCAPTWNNNGQLSALDVYGIRAIYGPFTDDTPMHISHTGSVDFIGNDGQIAEQHTISYDAFLTREDNRVEKTFSVCNGDDLRVEITSQTVLPEGLIAASVLTLTKTYITQNCAPGGQLIDEDRIEGALPQPGDGLFTYSPGIFEVGEAGFGRGVRTNLSPARVLGRDVTPEDCSRCIAAAQTARFGPETPPLSLSSASLHTASGIQIGIASPWPDDFNIDLEVCARATKAGPDFANAPWTEENISRLCSAAPTSQEPATCYARIMTDGLDYGGGTVWNPANALSLCAGTTDSIDTIACFSAEITSGATWQAAIPTCAEP